MKKALCFACLFLVGCAPVERDAYNLIVGTKASLVSYRQKHPECNFVPKTGMSGLPASACVLNDKITGAKDVLIDAVEVYCSGPQFENGGTCNAPAKGTPASQQASAKLQAAVANLKQILADSKGAF